MMIPHGVLVVSCQARGDNPLTGPDFMAAMARAAAQGGAGAIRAQGGADIAAIDAAVTLPIIGLIKREDAGYPVYITPDFDCARAVAEAGADVIAIDATPRPRHGEDAPTLIRRIHDELHRPVLADIATLEEGLAADSWGADYVASTLSGYTGGRVPDGPDLDLVASLARRCKAPVVAEGRYWSPAQVARAFALGAHAVCVGTAITNPREITRRFVAAAPT
jgi:putative N-acetylmannosamine-6-phosphate epimerase